MPDALRVKEIQRRRLYAEELRLIAEIEARGICDAHGHYVGAAALIREMFNLTIQDLRRMVTHAELLNETVSPSGARIRPTPGHP